MSSSIRRSTVFIAVLVGAILLTAPAQAQVQIKVNDNVFMRLGFQLQAWGDEQQDAATKAYAQNLFIRRARFLVTGQVAPNVSFFFQTDNPNVGKVPKALTSGFILQDAWAEWRVNDYFGLAGGEFLVPLSRQSLTSTSSFLTLDISGTSTVFSTPTQSNGLRDTGFQAKGWLADGRLEYRAAILQGIRIAANASGPAGHDPFRRSAFLQYDFFEKERGYVFPGTNLGKRKIVALSAGYDAQSTYKAYSGSVFANVPVNGGDEVGGLFQHNRYNGGTFIAAIPNQRDELLELGYYLHQVKFQPFAKYEEQKFSAANNPSKDQKRVGIGAHYYIAGQNVKVTGQYFRVKPSNHAINSTNEFTVELQFWYY